MSNLGIWVHQSARVMAADRPDLWFSVDTAILQLSRWFSELSDDKQLNYIGSGGWLLFREDLGDDLIEYSLVRHVTDYTVDVANGESDIFNWTENSDLIDIQLDLPVVEE